MHIGGCDHFRWEETTIFLTLDIGGSAYRTGTFVPCQLGVTELIANVRCWFDE
jgi:hypothetical protein